MKNRITTFFLVLIFSAVGCQNHAVNTIFSHNDYAQSNPFYGAYELHVGYIEADVFLKDDQLFVAHVRNEIKNERTLTSLYLIPIQKQIINNKGWAYPDSTLKLKLMVDLKTEGVSTLRKLVDQLSSFPELINGKAFEIFISGNVPQPDRWNEFPDFIHFDGRPGIKYSIDQLNRINLISTNFRDYSKWDGRGELPKPDRNKLDSLIISVHAQGKKIRFWSAPDLENGWMKLMKMNVDVISTDRVSELARFLK